MVRYYIRPVLGVCKHFTVGYNETSGKQQSSLNPLLLTNVFVTARRSDAGVSRWHPRLQSTGGEDTPDWVLSHAV